MKSFLAKSVLAVVLVAGGLIGTQSTASAHPHHHCHGGPVWHDTSHFDYHPGYYQSHGDHYHYIPGHYHFHRTGHWHW